MFPASTRARSGAVDSILMRWDRGWIAETGRPEHGKITVELPRPAYRHNILPGLKGLGNDVLALSGLCFRRRWSDPGWMDLGESQSPASGLGPEPRCHRCRATRGNERPESAGKSFP